MVKQIIGLESIRFYNRAKLRELLALNRYEGESYENKLKLLARIDNRLDNSKIQ